MSAVTSSTGFVRSETSRSRSPEPQRRGCERLVAALPNARLLWLDDLHHVAHTAAPHTLAAELRRFLRAVRQSSQPGKLVECLGPDVVVGPQAAIVNAA